jgi:hypothetical protein
VAEDWRPYWDGRWACYPGGMTWISSEPWGYLTCHFGRWGWGAGLGWYWIPGVYYSPAWVAWGCSDLYFGWAPLGFYNVPVAWGYGAWRGGYAWNVVNRNFINGGNLRSRTFVSAPVVAAFSRPGAVYQGRLLVTPAEFRNPGQIQRVAQQPGLLRERTAAYAQAAQAATGRTLLPAQAGGGRFEAARPEVQHPVLREPSAAPRTGSGERLRRDESSVPRPDGRTAPALRSAPQPIRPGPTRTYQAAPERETRPGRGEGETAGSPREEVRPGGGMGRGGEQRPH